MYHPSDSEAPQTPLLVSWKWLIKFVMFVAYAVACYVTTPFFALTHTIHTRLEPTVRNLVHLATRYREGSLSTEKEITDTKA